jgi:hypothetical protein
MKAAIRLLFYLLILVPQILVATVEHPPIRTVSTQKIQNYLKDKDFVYERNQVETTSIWDIIGRWIERHLFSPLFKNHELTVWDIILYGIALTALILIVYYFIKSDKIGLFSKKAKGASLGFDLTEEDIHQVDFDKLVSEAITNGQYRIAIRFLYLKSLKELSLKGLIRWKADKTNHDYINEMRASASGKLFKDMTYLYDYAWYGHIDINENSFNRIKATFEQFNNMLHSAN